MDTTSAPATDQQLLRDYVASRNQQSFQTLVARHIDWIYSAALRLTRNSACAEDITQSVLLALSQKAATLQNHPALAGWLFRATRFAALALQRSERLRKKYEESAMPNPPLAEEPTWSDLEPRIDAALARLGKSDRHILLLRFYQQLPVPDIAATLQISQDAARKRTDRALERLRSLLGVKSASALAALLTTFLLLSAPKHLLAAAAIPKTIALTHSIHSFFLLAKLKTLAAVLLVTILPVALVTAVITHLPSTTTRAAAPAARPKSVQGTVLTPDGKPAANVTVECNTYPDPSTTTTTADGRFSFSFADDQKRGSNFIARSPDNSLQADASDYDGATKTYDDNFIITLAPARAFPITVTDQQNNPVRNARILASNMRLLGQATTNAQGTATLLLPANSSIEFILAYAEHRGLDYKLFWKSPVHNDPFHLEADYTGPIHLTLAPSTTVTIKAVDDHNNPLPGATVEPWLIYSPNHGGEANLSGVPLFKQTTGPDGTATFSYIPTDVEHPIEFWVRQEKRVALERFNWDPKSPTLLITATLYNLIPVTGHVKDDQGNPIANATIRAGGDSYGWDPFHEQTTSAADGSFSLDLSPEQYYLFVAEKDHYASLPVTQIIHKSPPTSPIDLTLQPGIRLYGQLTAGPDDKPIPKANISLVQFDNSSYDHLSAADRFPGPILGRKSIDPSIHQYTQTDDQGYFEFYTFSAKDGYLETYVDPNDILSKRLNTSLTSELQVNLHADDISGKIRTLAGRVTLSDDPPIYAAQSIIKTALTNQLEERMLPPSAVADKDGKFQIRFSKFPFYLFASTPDGSHAAILPIDPNDPDTLTLKLQPTTSAKGRLVDAAGNPLPSAQLQWGTRIQDTGGTFEDAFGGKTTTANDGTFTIPNLVPASDYTLSLVTGDETHDQPVTYHELTHILPPDAAPLNLGDVRKHRPPPIIHPATPPF